MLTNKHDLSTWLQTLPTKGEVYPPEIDDLWSLYSFVKKNRIVSILEFGSGWSTCVLAQALYENYQDFGDSYLKTNRNPNPFKILSLDASEYFTQVAKARLSDGLIELVDFEVSTPRMSSINGIICHLFDNVPNFSPDLIYLDGPDCDQVTGDVSGFSVSPEHPNSKVTFGTPISGDLIRLEYFLQPGTKVIVDGRGANAEFLNSNFARSWKYEYWSKVDQHFFSLTSDPWGTWNKIHLER